MVFYVVIVVVGVKMDLLNNGLFLLGRFVTLESDLDYKLLLKMKIIRRLYGFALCVCICSENLDEG